MSDHAKPTHTYDLFVSYAKADHRWVKGVLFDALDRAGVKYHSEATFELGEPRVVEFERGVKQSRYTLLVLSPNYLNEAWTQFVERLARSYSLNQPDSRVIPLKLYEVELPERLRMLTALDATDESDWPMIIERLCETVQRPPTEPAKMPLCPYPGMVPFALEDAAYFFGREEEIEELYSGVRHQDHWSVRFG